MTLSDVTCRNAKPKTKAYKLFDGEGLYLEIAPSGSKYWRYKYRFGGKEKRLAVGVYPRMTIKEARESRIAARKLLDAGTDPSLQKQIERRASSDKSELTFRKAGEIWYENYKSGWQPRHSQNILARLENDLYPELGHFPLHLISRKLVLDTIRKIEMRGAADLARRSAQYCSRIFDFSISDGRINIPNPALNIVPLLKPRQQKHFSRIEIKEIPEFLLAIDSGDACMTEITNLATKLLMHTLVRTIELIGAEWGEIDFDKAEWMISSERMKMKGRPPFVVPMSLQVVHLFRKVQQITGSGKFVFPHISKSNKHMSNNAILSAIKRCGYAGKQTGHGFRSLGVDVLSSVLKHEKDVVDKCLAHAEENKVKAAYFRDPYLEQRQVIMQEWSDYLSRNSPKPLSVVA